MKRNFLMKFLVVLACVGMMSACKSNEPKHDGDYEISIAKSAELMVTAGGRTLANSQAKAPSRNAGAENGLLYFKKSNCPDLYRDNFPQEKLYKDECEYVYACIQADGVSQAAGLGAIYEVDKASFDKKAFYIVNAYSSKHHIAAGDHSSVAGDMHDLAINGVYIKEFNTNTCVAADLILTDEGLRDVTYDDSFGQKKQTYTVSEWKLYYIPDYGYYVGMDYGCAKYGVDPDGDYSDWVVKVIPAEKKIDPVDDKNGQVEVNLSINDEHSEGDFVATKLSIHIRALTDVEIFIPVDKKYYCVADDMDISLSHREPNVVYNTDPQVVDMMVDGVKVTFMVQYEDEGIRVTTDGVDKQVIDYCDAVYADGITFEVWNYFKDITRADLKPMLDQSTITFLDKNPKYYINAFAKEMGFEGPIYSSFNEAGQLVPFTDPECTQPLDTRFWTRVTPDSKDYIFVGVPSPKDCVVEPVDPSYTKTEPDPKDPTLPDYNIHYEF